MADAKFNLDLIEVPTPCPVPWDAMQGDSRVRHCGQCRKNVYQLAELTRNEAEALIMGAEGEVCVQLYRRADGTVVTRDCAEVAASRSLVSAVALASVSVVALLGLNSTLGSNPNSTFSFIGGGMRMPPSYGIGSPAPAAQEANPNFCGPRQEK